MRSFLGFANYFRRLIQHYAKIASPLDEVTSKGTKFLLNHERQLAFEALKTALDQAPVVRLADVLNLSRFTLIANEFVIGAALTQECEEGWHPVAFASRKLNSAERNYTITEKEALAVIFALKCWRFYLFKHFDLYTDNQAVTYLRTKPHLRPPEARWVDFLADLYLSIHPIPDKENTADPLIRQTDFSPEVNSLEYSLDIHPDDAKLIEEGYGEDPEFFFFTQVQTPVTLCDGELWNILVVRLAHSANLKSRLRHVSSAPSVAYNQETVFYQQGRCPT